MAFAWESCRSRDPRDLRWGETGPRLVAEAVARLQLGRYLVPAATFCPVPYEDWRRFTEPGGPLTFGEATRAVHLWHELWRRAGQDKDADYPPDSTYELFKKLYLA